MKLKRQSEIAISMLAICARQPEAKVPGPQLAEEIGTTMGNTYQVVSLLVRNGMLTSERGPGGGVRLAMEAETIKLGDVLKITQPDLGDTGEASGQPNSSEDLLDKIVSTTSSFFVRLLDRFTVADLVSPESSAGLPCFDSQLMGSILDLEQEPVKKTPRDAHEVQ